MAEKILTPEEKAAADAKAAEAAKQDPLKEELATVKRTKLEKLEYRRKLIEKQIKEEGGEVKKTPEDDSEEDEVPEWFTKHQQKQVAETELQKADRIENETERELVKHYISSKNLTVEEARTIVNVKKNAKIAEMAGQKPQPRKAVSSGGGSGDFKEEEPEFTALEQKMMRPPFNMTKEKILATRKKTSREAGVISNGQSDRE